MSRRPKLPLEGSRSCVLPRIRLSRSLENSYSREPSSVTAPSPAFPVQGNIEQLGWLLYTDYLIPFEVASVLLLVAMVGAIILARREL